MINLKLAKAKAFFYSISSICLSLLCISCQSTKVYEKYGSWIYEDFNMISECTKTFEEEEPSETIFSEYTGSGSLTVKTYSTKITVISEPDYKFSAYSFFLKPFVIAGAATVSLGKCLFFSTTIFFCAVIDYVPEWWDTLIFGYSEEKEKMMDARAENKIEFYPEFHRPFTENHIIVEKTVSKTSAYKTKDEKTIVTNYEKCEYDNSIYVSREIKKDYYSTIYVVNHIGNIITIPVMVVSAVAGILINRAFIK